MSIKIWEIDKISALKGLKILLWNVRSLFPKIDSIREFVREVNGLDLLCINESWLKPELPNSLIFIDGYVLVRNDRTEKRGGGGG